MKPCVQAQHCMIPVILACRRWRQEDQRSEVQGHIWVSRKLEFNFDYLSEKLSQLKKKKKKQQHFKLWYGHALGQLNELLKGSHLVRERTSK